MIQKIGITGFPDRTRPGKFGWFFKPPAREGEEECAGTVGYAGKCYQGRDVHYIMWGYLHKLCYKVNPIDFNLPIAKLGVAVWKSFLNYDDPNFIPSAQAFTGVGYSRGDPGAENLQRFEAKECIDYERFNHVADNENILWHWNPYHDTYGQF